MEKNSADIALFDKFKEAGVLPEAETKELFRSNEIPTTNAFVARKLEDLHGKRLSFPVVIKVSSTKVLHKTDIGAIVLNICDMIMLEKHLEEMFAKFPGESILIEEMEEKGVEVIVGISRDPVFGQMLMFGLGGIFTEVYKDVSFRMIPITKDDAREMLDEIKGKKILEGYRGIKVDRDALVDLLVQISDFAFCYKDYVREMDMNPVFAREKDVVAVDGKILLCDEASCAV